MGPHGLSLLDIRPSRFREDISPKDKRTRSSSTASCAIFSSPFLLLPLLFQGICPGNRLQEIRTYDSGCYSMSPASSPCPSSIGSSTMSLLNSSLSMTTSPSLSSQQESIYENTVHLAALQRQDSRRSWQLASSNNLNQVSGTEGVAATNCVGSSVAIRKSIN